MIFFFDEAHLLFTDAPKILVQKIEQVVRLIRSKGVGVFFITQKPSDIPDSVLSQLGNRVQHALRAYTPAEQKAVKAAAASFRQNPDFDTQTAIAELGTGEALISFLDASGRPAVVEKAVILPPSGFMGETDAETRKSRILSNPYYERYSKAVDRYSAWEMIEAENAQESAAENDVSTRRSTGTAPTSRTTAPRTNSTQNSARTAGGTAGRAGRPRKTMIQKAADSTLRTIGREIGKCIKRTLLGLFSPSK